MKLKVTPSIYVNIVLVVIFNKDISSAANELDAPMVTMHG